MCRRGSDEDTGSNSDGRAQTTINNQLKAAMATATGGSAAAAAAAGSALAARRQRTSSTTTMLLPRVAMVAMKTPVATAMAGAQTAINNQLKAATSMATDGSAVVAVAAGSALAARWRRTSAATAVLSPCAGAVAMKTPAATAMAGAQTTINNKLNAARAMARETVMMTETMMTMETMATAAVEVRLQRVGAGQLDRGGQRGSGGSSLARPQRWRWRQHRQRQIAAVAFVSIVIVVARNTEICIKWQEQNYVRNYVFVLRPGTFEPLDSNSKKGTFGGAGKVCFYMFLCSKSCACGHDLRPCLLVGCNI